MADFVANEVAVVIGVENLVGGLHLVRFDLDTVAGQREESVVSVGEAKAGCAFQEVLVDWRIDLSRCEAVNDGVDSLDVG